MGKVWRIGDLIAWTTDYFKRRGIETARLDAELLLAHALECTRLDLYLNYHEPVAPFHLEIYRELIKRRAGREPVAYIIGEREFMGLEFKVDRRVMIPRPETEILVDAALRRVGPEGKALDLGTGSGAIAVTPVSYTHLRAHEAELDGLGDGHIRGGGGGGQAQRRKARRRCEVRRRRPLRTG